MFKNYSKSSFIAVFLLCLSMLTVNSTQAGDNQWTQIGPEGGNIQALIIDPSATTTLYAGTFGNGVFKSTDSGNNWTAINAGLNDSRIYSLAIDPITPTILYAGTYGFGVFKSTDGGASWNSAAIGLGSSPILNLAVDLSTPTTLYAGTDSNGIFKTTDSGNNWTTINSGLPANARIYALAIDPTTSTILYTGTYGNGVFKSTDGGNNWSAINTTSPVDTRVSALAIDPTTPTTLYRGSIDYGVYKSTDGGNNWTNNPSVRFVDALAIDPTTPSILYVSDSDNGILKSTDGGNNWTSSNSGLTTSLINVFAIDPSTPTTVYAGTAGGGIFKTTNGGTAWITSNTGLISADVQALAVDPITPTTLYAGIDGGGIFKSTDSGNNWNVMNSGLTNTQIRALAIDPTTPTTIYVGTRYSSPSGPFKSTDGGNNWTQINSGLTMGLDVIALAIDPTTPTNIYAGTSGGIFKSTNGGNTWTVSDTGLTGTPIVSSIVVQTTPTKTLYAAAGGGVFKSTDDGNNWTNMDLTQWANALVQESAVLTLYMSTSSSVFRRDTGDSAWTEINTGLFGQVDTLALDPSSPTTLYAGTYGLGVFTSFDRGDNWTELNTGLTNTTINVLATSPTTPTTLYAGTEGGGVFVTSPPWTQADLSIYASDSTDPVSTNNSFSYDLNIYNGGPDTASNIQVVNTLPSGVTFNSASGTDWICNESGGTVTCTLLSLNSNSWAEMITINLTAPAIAGSITNTATVSSDAGDPDTINNTASEMTAISDTPASDADLSITQTDSIDPVFTIMPLDYTLSVNNAGPGTANNIEVTDTLPGNVTFMSASGTDWMCNELSGTVTCTLANLSVGAANPIMISVMAPNTTGNITNNATVNATTTDLDTTNNNISESTQVDNLPPPAQADLSITKTGSVDSVLIGTRFSYVLNVNNAGPDTVTDIFVSDSLQNGMIFSSASGNGWTCYETGGSIGCSLASASLSVGAANPITINVIAPGTVSMLSNTAGVSTSANDPDFTNNNVSDSIQVYSSPPASLADLSVTQIDSIDPVLAGTSFTYTLNVNNAGPAIATDVEVVDVLLDGISFNSASGVGWTCNESNGTVICTQASLSVGVANPITINVTEQNLPGNHMTINNVSISSSTTPDPQTYNNKAVETTTRIIAPDADLSITLTDSSEPVLMDSNFSYTLNIANAGPYTATDVEVTDNLPMGVTFVNANGTDWNCNGSDFSVTCTLASLGVGTANPITINVTAPSTVTSLYNMANITSSITTTDSEPTNNFASETTTVNNTVPFQADLSITKTHTPDPVFILNNFRYTINVNNAGPDTATDIEVIDTLPNGVNVGNYPNWMCSNFSNTVTCTIPSLSVGAASPIHIDVLAPSTVGNITNNATVRSKIGVDPDTSNNSVSENAMVNAWPQADLSISKTDSVDPVSTSAAFSYTLNINNAGPVAVTDVEVTDILPVGVGFGSATGTDWNCMEFLGTVVVVKCTLANLNVGAANPITISVTAPSTAGSITNHASVKSTMMDDADMSNNNISEATTVISASSQADLSIIKTDSIDPVSTGAAFNYSLIINNAGPDLATTVEVTDTLPSGVTFGSASGTDWTCNEAAGTVTCTIASLSTGAANPITINVTAPGTAGNITNTATISATTTDPDTSNNNVSEGTTVNTVLPSQADLSITKTDSTDPVSTGAALSYTLTVNNIGPDPATTVEVTDTLPSGVTFGSASGTDWTCNEATGMVTCTIASLSTGAANPITINVTAPGTAGSITNTATISATTADADTSNNNVSESTTVSIPVLPPVEPVPPPALPPAPPPPAPSPPPNADLSIVKTDGSDQVQTEQTFSYVLTVSNAGPNTATDVEVIDTLPSGLSFVNVRANGWTCQRSGQKVTCVLNILRVDATSSITINVAAPSTAGNITNAATISAETIDPDMDNNHVTETTTVEMPQPPEIITPPAVIPPPSPPQADLSITKVDSADPDLTDDNSSYTLTVNNAGPDPAENVVITETLPSGVSLDSVSGTDWTCQEADNKVTCTLASLDVGANSSLTINVVGAADTVASTTTVSATTDDPVITDNSVDASTPVEKPTVPKPPVEKPIVEGPIVEGPIVEKPTVDIPPSPEADLSITQTGPSESVWTGSNFSYTLSINNVGPDTANNVEVTDILLSDFVSASGTDWSCNESGGTLICTLTSLSIGKANPITVNVRAPNMVGDITNEVMLSSATVDPEIDNNSTSETTVVKTRPLVADLLISKFDSNDPVLVNGDLTYTLNVNNVGPATANNITVTDTLPNGVIFGSVSGTNWKCQEAAPKVTCEIPKLDVGAANPITIKVTAPAMSGKITNKATVTAMTLDPNEENNTTKENTTVNPHQADLSINKLESHDSVLTNSVFSYTLNVNNAGPETANSVKVIDILPSTVTFNSASGTGWVCDESENTVVCELVGLNVGTANPITINVTAPDIAGDIINTATVSATTLDPEKDNNSISETIVVNAPPLLPTEQSLTLEVGDTVNVLNIKGGNGQRSVTENPDSDIASFTYSDDDTLTLTGVNRGITRLVISDSAEPPNMAILNITVRKLTCGNSHGMDKDGNSIKTGACFTGTISVTSDDTCANEPTCSRSGNHLTMIQSEDIGITANVDVDPQHIGAAAELLILAIQKHSDGTQVSYFRNAQGGWQFLENGDLSNIQATEKHEALPETVDVNILPQGSISNLLFGEFIVYTGYRLEDGSIIYNGQEPLHFFVANSLAMDKEGKQLADPFAYFTNEVSIDSEAEGKPVKLLLDYTIE